MLAVQMVAAHSAAMRCLKVAIPGNQTFPGMQASINMATKLMRTYTAQVEALNKHRNKAKQTVIVKHVHVHEGGQAIVGNVDHSKGGGGKHEKPVTTPCKRSVRSQDAKWRALQEPSGVRPYPMPDARGQEPGSAEGKPQCLEAWALFRRGDH
jgi:hypothetical protein